MKNLIRILEAVARDQAIQALLRNAAEFAANSRRVLVCGNGGSAAMADHLVGELVPQGVQATSMCNPAVMSALANDYSWEECFERQLPADFGVGDVLIGLTTGGSPNVLNAMRCCPTAYRILLTCDANPLWVMNGRSRRGWFEDRIECMLSVPTTSTQRAQEVHLAWCHQIAFPDTESHK